jgi:hypothetical protein
MEKLEEKDYLYRTNPATNAEYEEFITNVIFKDPNVLRINAARARKIKKRKNFSAVDDSDIDKWLRRIWYLWIRKKVKQWRQKPRRRKQTLTITTPVQSRVEKHTPSKHEAITPVASLLHRNRKRIRELVAERGLLASPIPPDLPQPEQKRHKSTMDPAVKVTLDVFWEQGKLDLEQVMEWLGEKTEQATSVLPRTRSSRE